MGRNNKARRAAKQRKHARQGRSQGRPTPGGQPPQQNPFRAEPGFDTAAAYALVEQQILAHVQRMARRKLDDADAVRRAESVLRQVRPAPGAVVHDVMADLLARLVRATIDGGWGPADLAELVRRCAGTTHVSTLVAVLTDDVRRTSRGHAWQRAIDAIAQPGQRRIDDEGALASALLVASLLASAPRLQASELAGASDTGAADHPKLAQVRALLAKAESTEFDEEAEALSAKAQELVAKYALGQLLDKTHANAGSTPQVRRFWLDAPYAEAKAALVHEVADANRCRSATASRFGFCVLVGSPADLEVVELLVTSLLVQADTAMLRHGRRVAAAGTSRTRSFRRSFLMAYAARIGVRLREVTAAAVTAAADVRMVPVLRDHETRVAAAFEAMMPDVQQKATTISNPEGWLAGAAAADLAQLDVNGKLTERTG